MKRLFICFAISAFLVACFGVAPSKGTPREHVARQARVVADVPAREHGQVAWDADRGRLLYLSQGPRGWGPVMLLDLAHPTTPTPVTAAPAGSVVWSHDKRSIAYTANRQAGERTVETILAKRLDKGEPIDLLPGDMAIKSVSTAKELHGWFYDGTLAYHEHMGTAMQQLFLRNVKTTALFTDERLRATSFIWNETGDRVAGQVHGSLPAHFWLWDRNDKHFLTPSDLPGAYQWFEAWSHDGRSLLFTAWDNQVGYGRPGARPTLYRLNVANGHVDKVADDAGLATFYGDLLAYVKFGQNLTLVVANVNSGHVLWADDLGELARIESQLPWGYRPTLATTFVGYRTADDEWRVSPHIRKESRVMFRGPGADAQWSPFGRYLAVHRRQGDEVRLQVLENPLAPGNPVPIEQALRVAHAAAKQWRPNPQLLRIIGQQTYQEQEAVPPPGSDGRRRAWAFEFSDPVTHEFVIVGTADGKVTGIHHAGTGESPGFDPRQFRVTGKGLVEQAKNAGILPGTGGIAGYQFALDDHGRGFVVSVVGVDAQGQTKRLDVDPATGKVLSGG